MLAFLYFRGGEGAYRSVIATAVAVLVKQYLILLIIPYFMTKQMRLAHFVVFLLVIAAVCAPFVISAPQEFTRNTVAEHLAKFRPDSLSLPSFFKDKFDLKVPSYLAIVCNVAFIFLLARIPRRDGPAGWLLAATVILLLANLLVMSKSFLNYYYLVSSLSAPLLAVLAFRGAAEIPPDAPATVSPRSP
jgi:predicted neutral ceramidase superfamily lipid hydrolase